MDGDDAACGVVIGLRASGTWNEAGEQVACQRVWRQHWQLSSRDSSLRSVRSRRQAFGKRTQQGKHARLLRGWLLPVVLHKDPPAAGFAFVLEGYGERLWQQDCRGPQVPTPGYQQQPAEPPIPKPGTAGGSQTQSQRRYSPVNQHQGRVCQYPSQIA